MKAVIMAGGEGTRLRPLTSNAPKPMLPIANRPMMEHIIALLQAPRLRRDRGDGRLPGEPHQDLLRRRLRVRRQDLVRRRAGAARHRRQRRQRPGDARRDVPRHLRRRAHRHRPRRGDAPARRAARRWPRSASPPSTTRSSSASSSPARTARSSGSWRSRRGVRCSATPSTPASTCSSRRSSTSSPRVAAVDFSSEVFPALLAAGKPLFGAVPSGYWEDVGTLEAYLSAHKDVLDQKVAVDIPGFRINDGVWHRRGRRDLPEAQVLGPAVIGPGCKVEAGCGIGEYTVLGCNVRVLAEAHIERSVLHDNVYVGTRHPDPWRDHRARRRASATTCASTRASCSATRCSSATNAVHHRRRQGLPVQDDRGRARSSTRSIVWERTGRAACSGATASPVWPTSTSRRSWPCAWRWPTARRCRKGTTVVTSRDSSRAARMLKRAMMAGLNAAGVDVLDLEVASVPVTRFLVRSPRAFGGLTVRLHHERPRPRGRALLRPGRQRHHRGRPAQDRAAVPARGLPPGRWPRRSATSSSRPGRSRSTPSRSRARSRPTAIRDFRFKLVVDYTFGAVAW